MSDDMGAARDTVEPWPMYCGVFNDYPCYGPIFTM